jgi:kynurenine formamidase
MRPLRVAVGALAVATLAAGCVGDTAPLRPDESASRTTPCYYPDLTPAVQAFILGPETGRTTLDGHIAIVGDFSGAAHGEAPSDGSRHFVVEEEEFIPPSTSELMDAAVLDVSTAAAADADYQVSVADLARWEVEQGQLVTGILLIRTGFADRRQDAARYLGASGRGRKVAGRGHFPGLSPEAARWLVTNRSISAVGIDTASIDPGQSAAFETHRVLYEREILVFENLYNLNQLPPAGAQVSVPTVKVFGRGRSDLLALVVPDRARRTDGGTR